VRRLPALDLELRVEDADLARPGRPLAREVEVRERGAVEVDPAPALEVFGRNPAVVLADELLRLCRVGLAQMLA
jgi:hypothetical protein